MTPGAGRSSGSWKRKGSSPMTAGPFHFASRLLSTCKTVWREISGYDPGIFSSLTGVIPDECRGARELIRYRKYECLSRRRSLEKGDFLRLSASQVVPDDHQEQP